MPLDPSIPLGVRPPQAPGQVNPFEMVGQWAQIQNSLNQNRLFQQTFAARQRAGQILSSAPDMEVGLQNLLSDPLTAPFAAETINAVRQGQLTLTQLQGQVQEQAQKGLDAFAKALPTVFADPTEDTWNNVAEAHLQVLSPQAAKAARPAIDSLRRALLSGLPEDPAKRQMVFTQRLSGMMLASGFTPEGLKALVGTPESRDLGGSIQPTMQRPPQLGGGEVPVGPGFPKTLPPTVVEQGGVPNLIGGGANPLVPQAEAAPNVSSNPLVPAPTAAPAAAPTRFAPRLPAPPAGATGPQAGPAQAPAGAPKLAADGLPLFEGIQSTPTQGRSNITGTNILSPAQQEAAKKQNEAFYGDEQAAYQNNINSLGALDRMDHALETMARSPSSLLQPGPFGDLRLEVARNLNQLGGMLGYWNPDKPVGPGNEPPVDPAAIATAEDLRKEATRAGMLFLSQTLGAQREAASVIFSTIQAVPGLDNTLLGGRLVSRSLRAAAQRSIDQRMFQEEWARRNQGDLTGSITAFNQAHPGEAYFEQVLNSMGMSEKGFQSPEAVKRAFDQGYLTPDEAVNYLQRQFPQFRSK